MSDNKILYCLIAFILGWLASRMMGNGFSVGCVTMEDSSMKNTDKPDPDELGKKMAKANAANVNWQEYINDYGFSSIADEINKYFYDNDKTEWVDLKCSDYENTIIFDQKEKKYVAPQSESKEEEKCKDLLNEYCFGVGASDKMYPCAKVPIVMDVGLFEIDYNA